MNREEVLKLLLARLEEERIPYCLVGDTRGFPGDIRSDVDIVIPAKSLTTIGGVLLRFCAAHHLRLVQVLQHEQTAWYFALSWFDENGALCFLNPDFCGDFFHLGRKFLGVDELLANRIPALDDVGRNRGFYILSPAYEFIYYLVKKIDKQELESRHGDHLNAQWRQDPKGADALLRRFWPEARQQLVRRAAEENAWQQVALSLPEMQMSLRRNLPYSPGSTWLELKRKFLRAWRPTGLMVAILGPDGSGKSSVINEVMASLLPAFRRTRCVHLRPKLWGGSSEDQEKVHVTDPHGKAPRNWLLSTVKLAYWWFDYTAGYFLIIRPQLARSTLVIFDRYYHDLLVDPRRYRFSGPRWLASCLSHAIPLLPDLFILLDAPVETLRQRKQEVAPDEITRQRHEYLQQSKTLRNHCVIDASQPLSKVVVAVNGAILEHMEAQLQPRFSNVRESQN